MRLPTIPLRGAVLFVAAAAIFSLGPLFLNPYVARVLTLAFMYAGLAQAWNLLGGFAGYASFGNVVFFGLGAYTTALLMSKASFPFAVAVLCSGALSAVLGVLMGPILRLHGHYFAIGTLAVAELLGELVRNFEFTGAATGVQTPVLTGGIAILTQYFYWSMLLMLVVTVAVVASLRYSRTGYALMAVRADESTAASLGIPTTRYKVLALVVSGLLSGMIGGVYAYWITFIDPPSVFRVQISVTMILMALFGGAGTILGPLLGAGVLSVIQELAWDRFPTVYTAVIGLTMVVLIIFLPGGVMDLVRDPKRFRSWRSVVAQIRRYSV